VADGITPGERRELRSVVKGQFKVLRAEVKRRADEMRAEIEAELVERYRDEDRAVADAQLEVNRILNDAARAIEQVGDMLRDQFPDLEIEAGRSQFGGKIGLSARNRNRAQVHRALLAAIPDRIGDANLALDRQEVDLLRRLSEGALDTAEARGFLGEIPSIGEPGTWHQLADMERQLGSGEVDRGR
jgi:uncharacterized protein YukE